MRYRFLTIVVSCNFLLGTAFASTTNNALEQSTHTGARETGIYPNLFSELLGISHDAVQAKLDSVFHQLFYGDEKTQRIYFPAGNDMAYIEDVLHQDVRTEGMSYGLMIAVQLDKKNEFDCLWKWMKTYMQHQSGPQKTYFAWQCKTDGTIIDHSAAADGEEWTAMALLFASARWGNDTGIYNYNAEAQAILKNMLHKESAPENDGSATNLFNLKEHQVVFVPNKEASGFTDPSYQLPHFYELWARWAKQDTQFWHDAAAVSRELFKKATNAVTGLAPDYSHFDGTPASPWSNDTKNFQYDAWRVAANIAMDYSWFAEDGAEVDLSNRVQQFFYSEGIKTYGSVYTLEGKKLANDHSTGLVAMNAVASLASTNAHRTEFVQELWKTPIPTGEYRYYDSILYLLGMMEVSGNFRAYDPVVHSSK